MFSPLLIPEITRSGGLLSSTTVSPTAVTEAGLAAGEVQTQKIGSVVAGKAYFLAQGEPLPIWEVVNRILTAGDLPPVSRTMSPGLAYAAGAVLETIYRLLRLRGEPRMTRFVARELSTAHWFDLGAAKRDFGYVPQVSFEEGIERLRVWLRER